MGPTMPWAHRQRDFHSSALWAGVTAFVWYAFGAVPLQVAVAGQLQLGVEQASSWIFIVWFGGAVSTIVLSLYYRQPLSITWSIPGLIYLGTLADQFTFAELIGANVMAALMMLVLSLFGMGQRMLKWLPLPIVLGMFAGSVLEYVTRAVSATVNDVAIAGSTVAGYLMARAIASRKIPPVGVAVVFGAIATWASGRYTAAPVEWSLPTVAVPPMTFDLASVFAVSVPMAILAMGLGNVQGLGFLLSQGYELRVNRLSVIVGCNSLLNALLGGHPATVARIGTAILAGPDAGPAAGRYWATVLAACLTVVLAFTAVPVASLIQVLPASYVFALAGVAILSSLQDAFVQSFTGTLRFGPLVAFVVAATPFSFMGITSALWALVAGVLSSLLAERPFILSVWRGR